MKLFKYALFPLLCFIAGSAIAMDLGSDSSSDESETVTILCADEQTVTIPKDLLRRCAQLDILNEDEGSSGQIWLQYRKADLEEFFEYLSGNKKIEEITDPETIKSIYTITEYLVVQDAEGREDFEFYRALIKKYKELVLKQDIDEQVCLSFDRFKKPVNVTGMSISRGLSFAGKDLETLRGLDKKVNQYRRNPLENLNISNNQLEELDVASLLLLFPNLVGINAENNEIDTLIIPRRLPKGFKLFLAHNKLRSIPYFRCEAGHFDFSDNHLRGDEIAKLRSNLAPVFREKIQHVLPIAKRVIIENLKTTLVIYCFGAGALHAGTTLQVKYNQPNHPWYSWAKEMSDFKAGMCGALIGVAANGVVTTICLSLTYLHRRNDWEFRHLYYKPSILDVSNQKQN